MSPPAQKALSPVPSNQTAAICSSTAQFSNLAKSWSIISKDKAFKARGAFKVATPIFWPLFSGNSLNSTGRSLIHHLSGFSIGRYASLEKPVHLLFGLQYRRGQQTARALNASLVRDC